MAPILRSFLLCSLIFFSLQAVAQKENAAYDKALADSLGADDYGMKPYVLVILKTGSNQTENKMLRDSLFRGHMQNINRLASNGKLVVAGPLQKNNKDYRGIFIFNVATIQEAETLVMEDPAVREKIFDVEFYQWYGSAALAQYLKYHDRIEKKKH